MLKHDLARYLMLGQLARMASMLVKYVTPYDPIPTAWAQQAHFRTGV
jgi:hypothetical protein